MTAPQAHTVHVYSHGWLPKITGDGTSAGLYSDLRAYLDLGWRVHFVHLDTAAPEHWPSDDTLKRVEWSHVPVCAKGASPARAGRLAYLLRWPTQMALDFQFVAAARVRDEVQRREREHPGSVHQFEYAATGAGAVNLPSLKTIFRVHDIESDFVGKHHSVRAEVEPHRAVPATERRALRRLQKAEQLIAHRAQLVLCYAKHEADTIHERWGCPRTAYLPISWPDEAAVPRTRGWLDNGRLRLLHVGRIDSLPSFRSLQFLLRDVFAILDRRVLDRIELVIAGEVRTSSRARAIQELASHYSNVTFLGFQPDLREIYGAVDLHVIGSTEATGLRTRIIESMAFGVPVLSTVAGAAGLDGDEPIAVAGSAAAFCRELTAFVTGEQRLDDVAARGRRHYDARYSRRAIAARLHDVLSCHIQ